MRLPSFKRSIMFVDGKRAKNESLGIGMSEAKLDQD